MTRLIFFAAFIISTIALLHPAYSQEVSFKTPSGNIMCTLDNESATCEIFKTDVEYTGSVPDWCEDEYGNTFTVGKDTNAERMCVSDTYYGAGFPTVSYGTHIKNNNISCLITNKEVICKNIFGAGFVISRREQKLF